MRWPAAVLAPWAACVHAGYVPAMQAAVRNRFRCLPGVHFGITE
jgi:hypothetical protein